ncbi:MAG: class I SAM-dependent methyltransferase [Pseudomonadota bacterium]|nr:class I SAM-dependent methyltransferase [Pseudomonadota bacterium]
MDESDLKARALAWSRYWRSGTRHSCPGSFTDHYGIATQTFWRACFERVAAGDRVLELGCGNGSLIRWLAQAGTPQPASYDATDLAELDETWLGELPVGQRECVHLHPRTAATRLPVGDGTVTQLVSQYALEYFADEACWSEMSRILAPRATLAAVVHHRGSHLCRLAQSESVDSQWLLADDGPLDRAAEMLKWLAMSANLRDRGRRDVDPRAAEARQHFNATYAVVAERIAAAPFPDLLRDTAERTMRILEAVPVSGEHAARQALDTVRAGLTDNHLRVKELVDCALDLAGIEVWTQQLRQMGFTTVEVGEIVEQGYLFGWSLIASRGRTE